MPRFRPDLRNQTQLVPVSYHHQLHPGTFEHALNQIVDEMDLSGLLDRYRNDEAGAPAYNPGVLLKLVLFAYSRGIISSRQIEQACRENVVFMALSGDSHPHFTTIAKFVSTLGDQVVALFRNVLVVCAQEGLIGRQMFAVDGCKISSNCAKEWSGTRAEFAKKKEKLETSLRFLMRKHRETDVSEASGITPSIRQKEEKAAERLQRRIEKLEKWLGDNPEDKKGSRRKAIQSNLVDDESAKLRGSHGMVQGYNGVAVVDAERQVIVAAEAFGEGAEQQLLKPMIEGTRANFQAIGEEEDAFAGTVLVADSGYSSEANAELVLEGGIEAYIPDTNFRKRDPRFAEARRYRRSISRRPRPRGKRYFLPEDFRYDPEKGKLICPAGKELYVKNRNFVSVGGMRGIAYQGWKTECRVCALRPKCLRNPKTEHRQVVKFTAPEPGKPLTYLGEMIERIDTALGRHLYSRRMGIVEPVFANLRHMLGLKQFTLRTKAKVDVQWKLYCMVHNIGKLMRFGPRFQPAG